jgi:cell division protein FtsW
MLIDRQDRSIVGRWWRTVDPYLLMAFIILIITGALMVTTSSPYVAERIGLDSFHFTIRQFIYLFISIFIIFGVSLLEPKTVRRLCTIGFIFGLVLMVLVLFVGAEIKGSTRWISLGPIAIQPSEFLKPCFFVVVAWMFSEKLKNTSFPGYAIGTTLYFMVILLLALQPDIGTSIMVTMVWCGQFFLAGLPIIFIALIAVCAICASIGAYLIFPHVAARIEKFTSPDLEENYQVKRSLEAFANGGFFGRGPGEGTVKKYIPDSHTDFIFSVIGEEMGLVMMVLVISLFAYIVYRGFKNLERSSDSFVIIACAGILMNFALQAIINMGVSLKLFPTKGMTLPFVSYGGSSTLAMAFGVGIILALTRKRYGTK